MKTKLFLLFVFCVGICLFWSNMLAQNGQAELAPTKIPIEQVEVVKMPILDNEQLQNTEMERRASEILVAPKFAEVFEVNVSPLTHGTWETVGATDVWRLRILSKMAYSINLGFSKYVMPDGGKLILYSTDKKNIIGPFTPSDNEEHEQLWTPVLEGEELVIEVQVPGNKRNDLELVLTTVNHDFMNFPAMAAMSGSCHLDVICGASDGWEIVDNYRDVIQSVAVISTGGNTFCSGFLVNNTSHQCIPYFMTAQHCGVDNGNAASLVAYWNYENSYCRQPYSSQSGNPGNGTLADFNTGSIFRSSYGVTDMTLVELDDPVSETANAFYAGWSYEAVNLLDTFVGIHHPNTDEKRINFEFDSVFFGHYYSFSPPDPDPDGPSIVIPQWDIGGLEPGSSGSPLFNGNNQVIGQLTGGDAYCGNVNWSAYGAFNRSWEGGGTPDTRLKDWLDPIGLGVSNLDGRWENNCGFYVLANPRSQTICSGNPSDSIVKYNLNISSAFENSVTLSLEGLPSGTSFYFDTNPLLSGDTTAELTISNIQGLVEGIYNMTVIATDGNTEVSYDIVLSVENYMVEASQLISPQNGSLDVSFWQELLWTVSTGTGIQYHVEVSTESDFNDPFISEVVDTNMYSFNNPLEHNTLYFWRIRAFNYCDAGSFSEPFSFLTSYRECSTYVSTDVPIAISGTGTPTIISTMNMPEIGDLTNLKITNLDITHSYISDLIVTLYAPNGNEVTLLDRICNSENNILIGFDQASSNLYTSIPCPPADGSYYQPFESTLGFNGYQPSGDWTLTVADVADQDGGSLNSWSLDVCYSSSQQAMPVMTISQDTEVVCTEDTSVFTIDIASYLPSTDTLFLEVQDIPSNIEALYPTHPIANMSGNELMLIPLTGIQAGIYAIPIQLSWSSGQLNDTVFVKVLGTDPLDQVELISPMEGQIDVLLDPVFRWHSIEGEEVHYLFELSSDSNFDTVLYSDDSEDTSYTVVSSLDPNVTYFWRVIASNGCVDDSYLNAFFTTAPITACITVAHTDTIEISFNSRDTIVSTLNFPENGTVLDVDVPNLDLTYDFILALDIFLVSPEGTQIRLIDNLCLGEDNINMGFDQDSPNNYGSIPCPPIEGDSYQPLQSLNVFNGEQSAGDWTLIVTEGFTVAGGSLNSWNLEVCYQQSVLVSEENIKMNLKDYPLSIHPNPAQNLLHVNYFADMTEPVSIYIMDVSGRIVKSYNPSQVINGQNNWQLDISNLTSGYYFISCHRKGQFLQQLPFTKIEE